MGNYSNKEFITTGKSQIEAGRNLVQTERMTSSKAGLVQDAHQATNKLINGVVDNAGKQDSSSGAAITGRRIGYSTAKKGAGKSISGSKSVFTYGKDLHQIQRKQNQVKKSFGSLKNAKGSETLGKLRFGKTKKVSLDAARKSKNMIKRSPIIPLKGVSSKVLDKLQEEDAAAGAAIGVGRTMPGAAKFSLKTGKKLLIDVPRKIVKITKKAIELGKGLVKGLTALIKAIAAGGWIPLCILLGILALFILIFLIMNVVAGYYESNKNTGKLTGNEAIVAAKLMEYGYDKLHVAGIMGNLAVESGCNPRSLQSGGEKDHLEGDERTNWQGFGIAQWTESRKNSLCTMGDISFREHSSVDLQVNHLVNEVTFGGEWKCGNPSAYGVNPMSYFDWSTNSWDCQYLCAGWAAYFERMGDLSSLDRRKNEALRIYSALMSTGDGTILGEAQAIANDDSHGYSQTNRFMNPDVDCSSFVFYACCQAGYNLGGSPFSTQNMESVLCGAGFVVMPFQGLQNCVAGDILMNSGHTEIYAGGTNSVGAHWDNGHPEPGDQGGEVDEGSALQSWSLVFRAPGK